MKLFGLKIIVFLVAASAFAADPPALDTLDPQLYSNPPRGVIEGCLTDRSGRRSTEVEVSVDLPEIAGTTTDSKGCFSLAVPPGRHRLNFTKGDRQTTSSSIQVPFLGIVRIEALGPDSTARVSSKTKKKKRTGTGRTSRSEERIRDRSVIRTSSRAPIPEWIEFERAVEQARGDTLTYDVNGRALGTAENRRFQVTVDERKLDEPFFGMLDWALSRSAMEDVEIVELGVEPDSAVGGSGAMNGALRLESQAPQATEGGRIRLGGGERSSRTVDLSRSDSFGERWHFRVAGSTSETEGFSVSRTAAPEYSRFCSSTGDFECLPAESAALGTRTLERSSGYVRLDRDSGPLGFDDVDGLVTVEAGFGQSEGIVRLTDFGRIQTDESEQPWAAARFSTRSWQISGNYRSFDSGRQSVLGTDDTWVWDSTSWAWRVATTQSALAGKLNWSFGATREDDRVDSLDPDGPQRPSILRGRSQNLGPGQTNPNQQTLLFQPVQSESDAYYGKVDWAATDNLQVSLGLRYDDGSLFDPQWSSRVSIGYSPSDRQTLRLAYHEGFVAPSLAELYLLADVGQAVQLGDLERICAFDGVVCGFDLDFIRGEEAGSDTTPDTRTVALGNPGLEVESTRSLVLGYHFQGSSDFSWSLDLFNNEHENLISDLVPAFDALGRPAHSMILGYSTSEDLSPDRAGELLTELGSLLGPRFGNLTRIVDGTPVLAESTYVNLGDARSRGVDVGLRWNPGAISLALTYSYLDFEVERVRSGVDPRLLSANAPENRVGLVISYLGDRWGVTLGARWFDDYLWVSGPFRGTVESQVISDVAARWDFSRNFNLNLFAENLTSGGDHQVFGGALLDRRVTASLGFEW